MRNRTRAYKRGHIGMEEENTETQAPTQTDAQKARIQACIAEIAEKFGFTCTSGKCKYVEMSNADVIKHVRGVQPAGARADAADLISMKAYSTRMKDVRAERTFVDIALEFDFDSNVVRALKQLRIDAHKGVKDKDLPRTESVGMHGLAGEEIDELRKARKDASSKSRKAKRASRKGRRKHGGAGEHIANFFTFGGFGRSRKRRR